MNSCQLYKVILYTLFERPVESCYISQCKILSAYTSKMTHHLSPLSLFLSLSGCRLPGETRPSQWAWSQEEVLADPVCGGVLSQPQHRPQGPEGGESASGWPHEHQDCRYHNKCSAERPINWFMDENCRMSVWSHLVLIHCLPWSQCWCSSEMS